MIAPRAFEEFPGRRLLAGIAPEFAGPLSALAVAAALVPLAAAHGGYFPTSWGWATLVFLWAAAMGLLLRRWISLSRAEIGLLLAASALVCWIGLSIVWSSARVESVGELERALVYGSGLLALLVVTRTGSVSHLLAGLLVAVALVAAYALATRLLPDRVGTFDSVAGYRLSEPVGYWNALGIFAAMGALLALGFAARARHAAGRAAAAASLPVLLLTLYFTFGRGGWIAFGLGLALTILLDSRRLQLLACVLVLAPASVLVVWLGSRSEALTTVSSPLPKAAHEGHRLALVLLTAVAVSALLALALAFVESRFPPGRGLRVSFAAVLVAAVIGGLAGVFAEYGGPPTLARKAYDSFTSPPVTRGAAWRAAVQPVKQRPHRHVERRLAGFQRPPAARRRSRKL